MKISIMCESMLLQEALNHYLLDDLSSFEECEFVISDTPLHVTKPVCLINSSPQSDIKKPFSQKSLLEDLQEFYHSKVKATKITANLLPHHLLDIKNPELKMQIDSLLEEFSTKIYQTLKKHEQ
ncbi:hypothetical protein [Helicobacter sp. 11S03491-1]|uniref:hypothetical protein n=1 Tax=Helicobacter sp. 11S03491-1 TaxID=1476196 RepID=UPI00117B7343|nr:hypothetical protein [Helicobacter sp. 11S03491-1]